MRTTKWFATAATVVLIGGGIATAQDLKKDEHPTRAPAAQQHAPAEKIAPPIVQSTRKAPETTGQATHEPENNAISHASDNATAPGLNGKEELKARQHSDTKSDVKASDNNANEPKASESTTASGKAETRSTTGQGSAAGAAKLTTEQRTKIATIFHKHKVAPVRLNVSITVGTQVPHSVHLYPLPVEVVAIYPEWRGYDYVMVGNEILVIDPGTHEIVAILTA